MYLQTKKKANIGKKSISRSARYGRIRPGGRGRNDIIKKKKNNNNDDKRKIVQRSIGIAQRLFVHANV